MVIDVPRNPVLCPLLRVVPRQPRRQQGCSNPMERAQGSSCDRQEVYVVVPLSLQMLMCGELVMRLFKPLEHLQAALRAIQSSGTTLERWTAIGRQLCYAGYLTFDALVWVRPVPFAPAHRVLTQLVHHVHTGSPNKIPHPHATTRAKAPRSLAPVLARGHCAQYDQRARESEPVGRPRSRARWGPPHRREAWQRGGAQGGACCHGEGEQSRQVPAGDRSTRRVVACYWTWGS